MQTLPTEEKDLLGSFEEKAQKSRRQLLPVWFLLINGLLVLIGLHSFQRALSHLLEPGLASYIKGLFIFDAICMMHVIPAVLFFTLKKYAVYWAKPLGIFRILFSLNFAGLHLMVGFGVFLNLAWIAALIAWTIYAFRISKRWNTAPPAGGRSIHNFIEQW